MAFLCSAVSIFALKGRTRRGRWITTSTQSACALAGNSVDLSPNADLAPRWYRRDLVNPPKGEDAGSVNDRYFYKLAHSNQPFANARRFQFRDVGCTGKCEQILPPPPGPILPGIEDVFVLVGFKLFFTGNRDHHMDTLAVYENNRKLTVEFNDKNDDDVFGYLVDYAWVRRIGVNIQLGEESGSARGGARVTLPPGQKVIRGFRFDFRSKDHELREVGVLTSNDRLEVYYSDKNADDHSVVR